MHPTKRWTVVIDIENHDGRIRAVARLHQRHTDRLVAVGRVATHPSTLAGSGDHLATADALERLSRQLHLIADRQGGSSLAEPE